MNNNIFHNIWKRIFYLTYLEAIMITLCTWVRPKYCAIFPVFRNLLFILHFSEVV